MTEWKKKFQVNKQRFRGMLGFAMRAGKLIIGTEQVIALLGKGKIQLIVLSFGASEATRKRLHSKSEYYGVELVEIEMTPEELGRQLGKSFAPVCIGVCDTGFAKELSLAAASEG